jgi:hypothetical protein
LVNHETSKHAIFWRNKKMMKSKKIFALTLLMSLLVIVAVNASVNAQGQATVIVTDTIGGSTDPAAGTQTYADGTSVTFTATADNGYAFQDWIFSTPDGANTVNDASITIPVTGGTTYTVQANFVPLQIPPNGVPVTNYATAATVVVLTSAGGTTSPIPGSYALADASAMELRAIPDNGWTFSHWVISGPNLSHGGYPYTATPTDNPYNVNHGYGNRFAYQAIFVPTGTTEPTPSVPEFSSVAAIGVALVLVAVAFGTITYRRKTK